MIPIVEIEKLSFSYPNTSVLSNVSLTVNQGEMIGIIGPNGGGKTTLLKLIMGFLKPTKGKIRVFGESPFNHSKQELAYVPQAMRFDRQFPISVLEVVLSGLLSQLPWYGRFRQTDRQAAFEALEKVGLAQFYQAPFGSLSGGQAQRILIARALVSNPKLLLLDEPTASVDSQAQADIYTILKKLQGKVTTLMVTHDLRTAVDLVQRLFCVQGSVFSLKPEQVCEHFAIGLYHAPLIQTISGQSI
jgi:zinc transport system ATP-binding protein